MPFLLIIQALATRIILGIIALLTAVGIGSVTETPKHTAVEGPKTEVSVPRNLTLITETPTQEAKTPKNENGSTKTEATPVTTTEPPPSQQPQEDLVLEPAPVPLSFTTINEETHKALVNILCSSTVETPVSSITGSGVIISPNGVIITNSHVAQLFLVKDYPSENSIDCIIRTGSPARATYRAELLYIAPQWIQAHAQDILNEHPTGTGENDYAFLRITERTDPQTKLPDSFPYVVFDTTTEKIGTGNQALVAAYPAGFLDGSTIQKNLYIASSIATIGEYFTFHGAGIDLFSLGGTIVSQGGSSGGAVVSDENKLIGIIVTSTQATTTAERDMRAISIAHINRSLIETLGSSIATLISGNIALTAESFNTNIAPTLTSLLLTYIIK
jgi:hypothetical protein